MKLEIATTANVLKEKPVRLMLESSSGEITVVVVDELGRRKYLLLGIRNDGTFVPYAGSDRAKKEDGFLVNCSGQIVMVHDYAVSRKDAV